MTGQYSTAIVELRTTMTNLAELVKEHAIEMRDAEKARHLDEIERVKRDAEFSHRFENLSAELTTLVRRVERIEKDTSPQSVVPIEPAEDKLVEAKIGYLDAKKKLVLALLAGVAGGGALPFIIKALVGAG